MIAGKRVVVADMVMLEKEQLHLFEELSNCNCCRNDPYVHYKHHGWLRGQENEYSHIYSRYYYYRYWK